MASKAPKISVIIPLYNTQEYVETCIQSLRNQSFQDFEAICIDDASTDQTLQRAQEATLGDNRFRFIQQNNNAGPSAARNKGLTAATGEWIAFLDSDDYFQINALERMYTTAQCLELDLVDITCTTIYESEDLKQSCPEDWYMHRSNIEGVLTGQELFCRYQELHEYAAAGCFHFIKRSLLEDASLQFTEGILHEDELFSPLLHAHAKCAYFLNEGLYMRVVRTGSRTTTKRGIQNVKGLLVVTQGLTAWLADNAQDCTQKFIDAFTGYIWFLRDIMAHDILQCSEEELTRFAQALPRKDAVDFYLYGMCMARDRQSYSSSRAWQIANKLGDLYLKLRP